MDLLYTITKSKEHEKFMSHPVIVTFANKKWENLQLYYKLNLLFISMFWICTWMYAFKLWMYRVPEQWFIDVFWIISIFLLVLRELLQFYDGFKRYCKKWKENVIDWSLIISSIIKIIVPYLEGLQGSEIDTVLATFLFFWSAICLLHWILKHPRFSGLNVRLRIIEKIVWELVKTLLLSYVVMFVLAIAYDSIRLNTNGKYRVMSKNRTRATIGCS